MKFAFQDVSPVLQRFGEGNDAVKAYRRILSAGIESEDSGDVIDIVRQASANRENSRDLRMWVIGDKKFVQAALEHDRSKRLAILQRMKNSLTLEDIATCIAENLKLEASQIRNRGRENDRSKFRKIFSALAHRDCGFSIAEIARFLRVGSSSVSRMLGPGQRFAKAMNVVVKQ